MKNSFLVLLGMVFCLIQGCSDNSLDVTNDPSEPKVVDKTANLQSTGDSANDILSNSSFSKLKVEIAYVEGFGPTQEAIDGFISYLKERTFKEEIEVEYASLSSPDEESLTLEEIIELENQNRTVYNDGNTLGIYIYFSDAPAEGDDLDEGLVTLGAVYRNTSMIIHEATVRRLADQSFFITDADVELTTLNHEFGHLFGLVNLGSDMVNDHEDVKLDENGEPEIDRNGNPVGNNHCSVEGCLMRAELQFGRPTSKGNLLVPENILDQEVTCRLNGNTVMHLLESKSAKGIIAAPELDNQCLLDLANNGGR